MAVSRAVASEVRPLGRPVVPGTLPLCSAQGPGRRSNDLLCVAKGWGGAPPDPRLDSLGLGTVWGRGHTGAQTI